MILGILIFFWLAHTPEEQIEGQMFMGSKYHRTKGRKYTHARKRKKMSDGRYHYFND